MSLSISEKMKGFSVKPNLLLFAFLTLLGTVIPQVHANPHPKHDGDNGASAATGQALPDKQSVSTHHRILVEGHVIHYRATAGTILLRGRHNKPTGAMFFVAYVKEGGHNTPPRPITFLYNGGPGSSSIWLHMGGLGPYRVNVRNAGPMSPAPYSITPNRESLIDDSDLVFIDAMGTGYSHVVDKGKYKSFWGVNQDVQAFGQFIERYLTKYHRWNSPKFLYGESYGTTRSAMLADWLQDHGIALNGVVLQSSILNYFVRAPGYDQRFIYYLPSYQVI